MDNVFSIAPGISKPGPRVCEGTDSEGSGGEGKLTKLEMEQSPQVPPHLDTPSSGQASFPPSSSATGPPLLPLLWTQALGTQLFCLCLGVGEEEGGRDQKPYDHPSSQVVACYSSERSQAWGFCQSGDTNGSELCKPGFLFPLLACTGRGPVPAGGCPWQ